MKKDDLVKIRQDHIPRGVSQALPAMSISESGYLPLPHLNKYGQEYPPAPDESGAYPVIRK